jgi:hypothetical protein
MEFFVFDNPSHAHNSASKYGPGTLQTRKRHSGIGVATIFGYPEFVIDIPSACCGAVPFRACLFEL